MKLSDISIQRPVFAVVMSLLLLVLGVMSFTRLTLRELPAIDPPIVSVSVDYTGASAAVIESRITQVLEDALAGIEGIDTINARSTNGRSQVSIEFTSNRDIEAAANDVRDAVSRVADRMPEEARPPEIAKVESDADPIIWFNMVSSTMDTLELSDYADRYVVDRFSSLDGVAQVRIGGRQRYAMRIWLDRDQLAARGLTTGDVETALRNENVELPAGRIESTDRDFTLRVERNYIKPEDFATIPLGKGRDGYVVRMGDVAKIELAAERRAYYRSNGEPGIGLGIVKTSTANSLDVARTARAEAERVALTQGHADLRRLRQHHLHRSCSGPRLRHPGGSDDPGAGGDLALPRQLPRRVDSGGDGAGLPGGGVHRAVCVRLLDQPADLLALVLCIGLVVDDAIVVVENVQRRIGEPPLVASSAAPRRSPSR